MAENPSELITNDEPIFLILPHTHTHTCTQTLSSAIAALSNSLNHPSACIIDPRQLPTSVQ